MRPALAALTAKTMALVQITGALRLADPRYWLVLRASNVKLVLRRPDLFSSALGATQIRNRPRQGR